jgi:hypothetical protein
VLMRWWYSLHSSSSHNTCTYTVGIKKYKDSMVVNRSRHVNRQEKVINAERDGQGHTWGRIILFHGRNNFRKISHPIQWVKHHFIYKDFFHREQNLLSVRMTSVFFQWS